MSLDSLEYPRMNVFDGVLTPDVRLPFDWEVLVPLFMAGGGKDQVEAYVDKVRSLDWKGALGNSDDSRIRTKWSDRRGLEGIDFGHSGFGLDERDDSFNPHNLGGNHAIQAYMIATFYVQRLLAYRKD